MKPVSFGSKHYLAPSLTERSSRLYARKSSEAKKPSDEEILKKLAEDKPQLFANDEALKTLGTNQFRGRLEAHIRDYNRGEGYKSSELYAELGKKSRENSLALAQTDPGALSLYAGLTTSFGYDKQARMVTTISETIHENQKIIDAVKENSDE